MPAHLADERFELQALPAGERWDAWRSVLAETHLPWDMPPEPAATRAPDAWVRRLRLGDAAIVDCGCDPCRGTRGAAEIAHTDGEYLAVLINRGGHEVLAQDGRETELLPGELTVWDSLKPAGFAVLARLRKRTLLVPRDELGALCPRVGELTATGLARRTPVAQLFTAYLDALVVRLPDLDPYAAASARTAALELLAAVLRPDAPAGEPALRAGLHARAVAHAEPRLADPRLTPRAIAAALGVSLRTLQLAFAEQEDAVAAHIRRRRLARGRADLVRDPAVSVTEVAFRWGFVDAGHFTRTFKREYGLTPRELRAVRLRA